MHRTIFKRNVNPNCSLILMHINVRSLAINCDKLKLLLSSMKLKPYIISLNETWLKQNQMGEINNLLDYVLITNSRKQSTGGGVGFYTKQNLSYCISDKYSIMNDKIFESLFVDIFLNTGTQKKDKFTIGTIYRSPNQNTDTNAQFIDSLYPIVQTISKAKTPAVITGDFNYNLLEYQNQHMSNFIDVMYEHSFFPTITKPTRITASSATVLDHIWTNVFNSKMSSNILTDCVADHLPVILCLETKNDIQKPKKKCWSNRKEILVTITY